MAVTSLVEDLLVPLQFFKHSIVTVFTGLGKSQSFMMPEPSWQPGKFGIYIIVSEIILLIIFVKFIHYGPDAHATDPKNVQPVGLGGQEPRENSINNFYTMFQDIHIMTFFGFAFLMTFLKNFQQSAVGLNLLMMSFALQMALVWQNIWELLEQEEIYLDIKSLIEAEFAATAVVVSFGAVIGKVSPLQLFVMMSFEVLLYSLNEHCGKNIFKAIDVGGSIFVHCFGAYFGLATSHMLYTDEVIHHPKHTSDRISNLFSTIGVLLLWLSWPSFNSVSAVGDDRHRAVINTFICLTASCISALATSAIFDTKSKFSMVHFRNGTLTGGVAIGASANMMTHPYGALFIGMASGLLAVLGEKFLSPCLLNKLKVHDTCGIHNLHGISSVLGATIGIFLTAMASEENYGKSLYIQFPARAPSANTTELYETHSYMRSIKAGFGRSALEQAGYQSAAAVLTLASAILGGCLIGFIIRRPFFEPLEVDNYYESNQAWKFAPDSSENET